MLIVIDMQPEFGDQVEECLPGVLATIEEAKGKGEGIVVVEYKGYGNSHDQILDALQNYHEVTFVYKDRDDGSDEILDKVKVREDCRCCGINTCWCVRRTMIGLKDQLHKKRIKADVIVASPDAVRCNENCRSADHDLCVQRLIRDVENLNDW